MAHIKGNSQNNYLVGTKHGDHIEGKGGADVIFGGKGNDYIEGNDGRDIIIAGPGSNRVDGGSGKDIAFLRGEKADWNFSFHNGVLTATDGNGHTNTFKNVEIFHFQDDKNYVLNENSGHLNFTSDSSINTFIDHHVHTIPDYLL